MPASNPVRRVDDDRFEQGPYTQLGARRRATRLRRDRRLSDVRVVARGGRHFVSFRVSPLQENPKQPPKRWWRGCVRGVRDSGSGADPQRVCGDLWYNRLSASKRREILKSEDKMEENPALWQARSRCLRSAPRAGRGKSKARTAYNAAYRAYIEAIKDDLGPMIAYQDAYDRAVFHLRHEKAARHIADCIHRDQKTSRRRNMQANPCPDGTCPNAGASYAPNQAGGGLTAALLVGGALLAGWLLLKPKPASAATPPGQQPGLPPGGPATCPLTEQLLDAWGAARGISVIYIPGGLAQAIIALVNSIPTLAEGMQLGNQYVVVLGDGSFWTPTGLPPNTVPAPAPAQKDDYCAWASQQPQTGAPPVSPQQPSQTSPPQQPSQAAPPNPVLPQPGSPLFAAQV